MHTTLRHGLSALRGGAIFAAATAAIPFAFAANPAPAIEDSPTVGMAPDIGADRGRDRDEPRFAPPVARHEVAPRAPSQRYTWVPGFWEWQRGHYVWMPGRWILPPREHLVWIAPRWDRRGNHYVLVPGYWRETPVYDRGGRGPRDGTVVARPLPPPRREVVPPRPSSRHVWSPGYWRVNGPSAIWIAGRWTLPAGGQYGWR